MENIRFLSGPYMYNLREGWRKLSNYKGQGSPHRRYSCIIYITCVHLPTFNNNIIIPKTKEWKKKKIIKPSFALVNESRSVGTVFNIYYRGCVRNITKHRVEVAYRVVPLYCIIWARKNMFFSRNETLN